MLCTHVFNVLSQPLFSLLLIIITPKNSLVLHPKVAANMGLFVVTFFFFRLMVCPYLWWGIVQTTFFRNNNEDATTASLSCLPWHFKYFWLLFGIIFNGLNGYWGVKIVLKVLRKVKGKEKMKEGNSLKES